jgi:hypothetical protein
MGSRCSHSSNHRMGWIMKQMTKQELIKLKKQATQKNDWEEVDGFKATKPTSIRLPPKLISDLEKIAQVRGEKSYQTLLKHWVEERVDYEMELIELAREK